MNDVSPRRFHVHAELHGSGSLPADFDDAKAGRPIERRLNRIERVVAAYHGQIDKRLRNGLHVIFESADAALLAACEMQHRCTALPQLSGNRLALRVGVHIGYLRRRSRDGIDDSRDVAEQLAQADDGIIASEGVVGALVPEIARLASPAGVWATGIAAFKIDWRQEIPSAAYGGESVWPANRGVPPTRPYLQLNHGMKTVELTREHPVATIGRDPSNDVVLSEDHVSRNHCRIERQDDGFILTDSSTNGTSVKPDDGAEYLVKNACSPLKGKGLLFFGRPFNGERRGGIRFEVY